MDEKLKEAIATARMGDKQTAQRQLTELLDENPEQVQGWYLLSLLVDSPQKQAAYLSKTLALNPNHEKAREQLASLQARESIPPTATLKEAASQSKDVLAQSETDELPDWLHEESEESTFTAVPAKTEQETAVISEDLPDWLKEPVALQYEVVPPGRAVEEGPTVVGKTAEPATKSDKAVADLKQTLAKPQKKRPKSARPAPQNTRTLNILLGVLVTFAIIVMVILAYLLLS